MPLYRLFDKDPIPAGVPSWAAADYARWTRPLSAQELGAIYDEFNRLIDERMRTHDEGQQIHTAGWIPGSDWGGTVWEPIYEKSALGDPDQAALCFGLMCFVAFTRRDEKWIVGKFEKDGEPIRSNTYFMARA